MKDIRTRMIEIQLAKDACKMKTQLSDCAFLENLGVPVVVSAMVEERPVIDLYDRINQIMEEAYEQS